MLTKVKKILAVYILFLLVMQVCRGLFLAFNYSHFQDFPLAVFWHGLRFDLSATAFLLLPYLLISFAPFPFRVAVQQGLLRFFFVVALFLAVVSNGIDFFYFPFMAKRSTFDLFDLLATGDDALRLLPQYLADYWYGVVVAVGVLYATFKAYQKLVEKPFATEKLGSFWSQLSVLILAVLLNVVAMRGGLQLKPLTNLDAGAHVKPKYVPLVLNTPFSMIRTSSRKSLKELSYLAAPEEYFTLNRTFSGKQASRKNVCVLILESFGKEYIGALNNYAGYTPFLDSLIGQSYTFTQALANGRKSVDALPSILSSLPCLMEESYIFSTYAANSVPSLASVLKTKGYTSAFFHGGANGTMRFDSYCDQAQIDHYYGLEQYPNTDRDFDGNWGVFDEPYLHYTADMMDTLSSPFLSLVFTLSSHHPYTIPSHLQGKFPKGNLKNHESIAYTDYALGQFFKYAKTKAWYKNTLFVITADHTSLSEEEAYKDLLGPYRIPILVFDPAKTTAVLDSTPIQQVDIAPMIVDLLGEELQADFFGCSPFDTSNTKLTYQYANHLYQFQQEGLNYVYDGNKLQAVYEVNRFPGDGQNLLPNYAADSSLALRTFQALIQTYNHALIHNSLNQ